MADILTEYLSRKRKADSSQREALQAEGQYKMALSQVKKLCGTDSLSEAASIRDEKAALRDDIGQKLKEAMSQFDKDWNEKLES